MASFTSTETLQCDNMEGDGNQVWAKRRGAALDVRDVSIGWLAAVLILEYGCVEPSRAPQSGGRYLLVGKLRPQHCTNKHLEVRECESPR